MKATKQNIRSTARPRGRTKRYIVALIAVLLAFTVGATALADGGRDTGGSGGQPRQGGPQGQAPQNSPDPENSGEGWQDDRGNAARNAGMSGVHLDKIEAAIAALTDETVQENLTALLETYETALDAKQAAIASKDTEDLDTLSNAVGAAKEALDAALTEAGVSTEDLYGAPELAQDGAGRMEHRPALDTTAISKAIAALEDSDENKAALTSLLGAYEAARAAQTEADASSLTEDEIAALAEAAQTAEHALQEALKNAGLAEESIQEQNQRQIQTNPAQGDSTNEPFSLNVLPEDAADTETESTGIFSAFLLWLRNLVH